MLIIYINNTINLYAKKQRVFLLYNDDLFPIHTFQIKSSLI